MAKIDKQAIEDLQKIRDELETVVESLQLMSDKEFMKSYNKAKSQAKNRQFADLDGLQDTGN